MRNLVLYIFLLLLCLQTGIDALSQPASDSMTLQEQKLQKALLNTDRLIQQRAAKDSNWQVVEQLAQYDTALKRQLYDYYAFGMQHRKNTFEWNLLSSKITFWVVVTLVFAGILFAALQFYKSMRGRPAIAATGTGMPPEKVVTVAEGDTTLSTELEANIKGIKVSSPVLGVIILIISLLFFYLYLVYVYPIQETF